PRAAARAPAHSRPRRRRKSRPIRLGAGSTRAKRRAWSTCQADLLGAVDPARKTLAGIGGASPMASPEESVEETSKKASTARCGKQLPWKIAGPRESAEV